MRGRQNFFLPTKGVDSLKRFKEELACTIKRYANANKLDLYSLVRFDPRFDIKESTGAIAELFTVGKVKCAFLRLVLRLFAKPIIINPYQLLNSQGANNQSKVE
jgi:hypothetical protein